MKRLPFWPKSRLAWVVVLLAVLCLAAAIAVIVMLSTPRYSIMLEHRKIDVPGYLHLQGKKWDAGMPEASSIQPTWFYRYDVAGKVSQEKLESDLRKAFERDGYRFDAPIKGDDSLTLQAKKGDVVVGLDLAFEDGAGSSVTVRMYRTGE
jgi:hypothetical protein